MRHKLPSRSALSRSPADASGVPYLVLKMKNKTRKVPPMIITSETPLPLFERIIHHEMNFVNTKFSYL